MKNLLCTTVLCFPLLAWCQNSASLNVAISVPESALLRIVDASASPLMSIPMTLSVPGIAGQPMATPITQVAYLQITSVKGSAPDNFRYLTVETVPALPSGLTLTVVPVIPVGVPGLGTGSSAVLSSSTADAQIVSNMESAYTGTSAGSGIQVHHTLGFQHHELASTQSGTITLRYTLSNF